MSTQRTHPYVKLAGLARGLRIAEEDLALVDPWDPTGVEERLRAEKPTRGDLLVAASLFRSIRLLVNATQKQRNAIATALLALPRAPHATADGAGRSFPPLR